MNTKEKKKKNRMAKNALRPMQSSYINREICLFSSFHNTVAYKFKPLAPIWGQMSVSKSKKFNKKTIEIQMYCFRFYFSSAFFFYKFSLSYCVIDAKKQRVVKKFTKKKKNSELEKKKI